MSLKMMCLLIIILLGSNSQLISQVDFILGSTYTKSYLWYNYIGLSIQFQNVQDLMNSTLYQEYHMNSNLMGNWANNWVVSLKTPLGHKYNCSQLSANVTNPNVTCTFQTQGNVTYWSVLGQFVANTMNQPNWCIGYDMQGVNLTLKGHQKSFYDWLLTVYTSTFGYTFCSQIVDYGDKMVQRGYKTSYQPSDFVKDIQMANYVINAIKYSGPGITEDASKDWLLALQAFHQVSVRGHYTVRCVVFKDPSKITIQNILSDNSSKYYLKERFMVNQTYGYTDFSTLWLSITDIKLTTGDGVDGLTNTFAAALWALDISIEFAMMNGYEIDFNHQVRNGNFQSFLGPLPDLKPSALYYGLLFAVLVRNGSPQIIVPSMRSYISSRIKAFGFSDGQTFKLLLINKDTNTSLNGKVLIKSLITSDMKCIYMEAPSLTSKDNITIGGYNFVGGSSSVNGSYKTFTVQYSFAAQGYEIPIKYAQAALCETDDSVFTWPKGTKTSSGNKPYAALTAILALILTILL